ncbi:MAG TPA: hypothetical protein VGQ51_06565 [Puia sp.]|jgi:hypothetical protein|nr:hypothetical protein [Puia sp.]
MNDLIFRVTVKTQLAQLNWLITVYLAIGILFYCLFGLSLRPPIAYIYSAVFLFDILPTLLVHVQYYRVNNGAVLDINRELHRISYITPHETLSYNFDDISSFVRVDSWGAGQWYSFAEYRYYKITFKDKKKIIITSLMIKDIKYVLEPMLHMTAVKERRFVAFIRKR